MSEPPPTKDTGKLRSLLSSMNQRIEIQQQCDKYQRSNFEERPPEFFALELAGETGEIANNGKKQWKGRTLSREQFDDEAANVFIALMNDANSRGIDLASAVTTKLLTIEAIRSSRVAEGKDY